MHSFLIRYLLILTIACLIVPANANGQAKVGTIGASFLELPFSARSNGLGRSGVSLIDDDAPLLNPGALGLVNSDRQANLSFLIPTKQYDIYTLYNGSAAYRLISKTDANTGRKMTLALAYNLISHRSPMMPVRTYENGTVGDTGLEFQATSTAHILTAGIAWEGKTDIGLGLGLMWLRDSYYNASTDGLAANLGLTVRRKHDLSQPAIGQPHFRLTSTAGLALLNIGPDLKMIEELYPLPKRFDIGYAMKLERLVDGRSTVSVQLILERHFQLHPEFRDHTLHLGSELGLYDALSVRLGHYSGDAEVSTYGLGINLAGLIESLVRMELMGDNHLLARLTDKLDLSYSYGSLDYDQTGFGGFHQISIGFK